MWQTHDDTILGTGPGLKIESWREHGPRPKGLWPNGRTTKQHVSIVQMRKMRPQEGSDLPKPTVPSSLEKKGHPKSASPKLLTLLNDQMQTELHWQKLKLKIKKSKGSKCWRGWRIADTLHCHLQGISPLYDPVGWVRTQWQLASWLCTCAVTGACT